MKKTNLVILIILVANIMIFLLLILKHGSIAVSVGWVTVPNVIFLTYAIKRFERNMSDFNLVFLLLVSSISVWVFTILPEGLVGTWPGWTDEARKEETILSYRIVEAIGVSFAFVGSIIGKKIGTYLKFISVPITLSMAFTGYFLKNSDLFDLFSLILLFASIFIATRKDKEVIADILKQDNKFQN